MTRLYTFGCSFTKYDWPTWADILGKHFDHYENWGSPGRGNSYIFNSLIECHLRNQLTPNDTVVIMWTGTDRVDIYNNNHWNILPLRTFKKVKELVLHKDRSDIRGLLLQSLSMIYAAKEMLDKWGVKYHFLSLVPLDFKDIFDNQDNPFTDILTLYSEVLAKIKPSFYEVIYNFNWQLANDFVPVTESKKLEIMQKVYKGLAGADWPSFNDYLANNYYTASDEVKKEIQKANIKENVSYQDPHPSPVMHLEYLQSVLPEYVISNSVVDWIREFEFQDGFDTDAHSPLNRL